MPRGFRFLNVFKELSDQKVGIGTRLDRKQSQVLRTRFIEPLLSATARREAHGDLIRIGCPTFLFRGSLQQCLSSGIEPDCRVPVFPILENCTQQAAGFNVSKCLVALIQNPESFPCAAQHHQ